MNEHAASELISAYLDGELTAQERSQVESHLRACAPCREERAGLLRAKRLAGAAVRRAAPPILLADLERRLSRPSWSEAFRSLWRMPPARVLWPVGAAAAAAAFLALWAGFGGGAPEESIPVEALLAAHSRYAAESLLPGGDLVASNFSAQLANAEND